jgi:signal transduction histidine kinase
MKVSDSNEWSLRRIETALQHGPVQNVTLALLKLDPVNWTLCDAKGAILPGAIRRMEDLEAIRDALSKTIAQMRAMTNDMVIPRIDELSPSEALARAAREHHRQSGQCVEYDVDALPKQLPAPLKACLYRIALDGLKSTAGGAKLQSIRASTANDSLTLEIIGGTGDGETQARLASLRDRIEALGGTLGVDPTAAGQLSLIAELNLSDMGIASG